MQNIFYDIYYISWICYAMRELWEIKAVYNFHSPSKAVLSASSATSINRKRRIRKIWINGLIKRSAHASMVIQQRGPYLNIPSGSSKTKKQQKESLRVACLNRSKGKADFEKFVNWSPRLIPPCASKRGLLIILASNWAGGIVISTQS